MLRRLFVTIIVLAVIAAGLAVVDVIVKDRVQSAIASRIESQSPGSRATVKISSFPFIGRLAVSGRVPGMTAVVTGVKAGNITFSSIRLTLVDLKVDHGDLFHGQVKPLSIERGRVVADIAQSAVDSLTHLPLVLGPNRIAVNGTEVAVKLTVSGDSIGFSAAGLPSFAIAIPVLDVLPCVSTARIVNEGVRLTCRFRTLPKLLEGASFGA